MNFAICALCIINIGLWGYILSQFLSEYRRKKGAGFYVLIMLTVAMVLAICTGTLIGRGVYITNQYGLTNMKELSITSMNQSLQIALCFAMLGIGIGMVYKIWKKRAEEL